LVVGLPRAAEVAVSNIRAIASVYALMDMMPNVRNEGRAPLLRASLSIALLGHMGSWGVALEWKAEQT
jgi:hypothetical protein